MLQEGVRQKQSHSSITGWVTPEIYEYLQSSVPSRNKGVKNSLIAMRYRPTVKDAEDVKAARGETVVVICGWRGEAIM
jgi:hypothetical protein